MHGARREQTEPAISNINEKSEVKGYATAVIKRAWTNLICGKIEWNCFAAQRQRHALFLISSEPKNISLIEMCKSTR